MVGEQVVNPRAGTEVVDAGHAVAIHGHRHRNLLPLPPSLIARDLDQAYAVIADATGRAPTLHRAPYGIYSWPALKAVRHRGWTPFLWSRWGRDWTGRATPHSIAATVGDSERRRGPAPRRRRLQRARQLGRTVAALPFVLESIAAAGLSCASLEGR